MLLSELQPANIKAKARTLNIRIGPLSFWTPGRRLSRVPPEAGLYVSARERATPKAGVDRSRAPPRPRRALQIAPSRETQKRRRCVTPYAAFTPSSPEAMFMRDRTLTVAALLVLLAPAPASA